MNAGCAPGPDAIYATPLMFTPPEGMCNTSIRAGCTLSRGGSALIARGTCAVTDDAAKTAAPTLMRARMNRSPQESSTVFAGESNARSTRICSLGLVVTPGEAQRQRVERWRMRPVQRSKRILAAGHWVAVTGLRDGSRQRIMRMDRASSKGRLTHRG